MSRDITLNNFSISAQECDPMHLAVSVAMAAAMQPTPEVPVGCVLVYKNTIISASANKRKNAFSPLNHAEICAIEIACCKLGSSFIPECEMYVTLEPCMMCAWSIFNARIKRVFYGTENTIGSGGFTGTHSILNCVPNPPEIYEGIMEKECKNLLSNFFNKARKNN